MCLVRGASAPGRWVFIPACTEADTPPVDRQTLVKILPWPNFVAAGNEETFVRSSSGIFKHCEIIGTVTTCIFYVPKAL